MKSSCASVPRLARDGGADGRSDDFRGSGLEEFADWAVDDAMLAIH